MYYFPFKSKFLSTAPTAGCWEITHFCDYSLQEISEDIFSFSEKKKKHNIPKSLGHILGKGYHWETAREKKEREEGDIKEYELKTRKQIQRFIKQHREREYFCLRLMLILSFKQRCTFTSRVLLFHGLCFSREWSQEGTQVFSWQWGFFSPG